MDRFPLINFCLCLLAPTGSIADVTEVSKLHPEPGAHNSVLSCSRSVYANDFNDDAPGPYADIKDWHDPPWSNGVHEGRAEIITGADAYDGRSLRIHYPEGAVGPSAGGAQWRLDLGRNYEALQLSYRVRFAPGFDFVLGGKLPGLIGGTAPSGCRHDQNGFSARGMWRAGGQAVQYMYWPHNIERCGDDYGYVLGGRPFVFEQGRWHLVEHHLRMNTPGVADGVLQAWVDGKRVLDVHDFLYREAGADFGIDGMYFSTFFGGASPGWAPTRDETVDFDEFVVCEGAPAPDGASP